MKGMGIGSSIARMDVRFDRLMRKRSLCDDVSIGFERDVFFRVKGISCVIKCCGYVLMSLSC